MRILVTLETEAHRQSSNNTFHLDFSNYKNGKYATFTAFLKLTLLFSPQKQIFVSSIVWLVLTPPLPETKCTQMILSIRILMS